MLVRKARLQDATNIYELVNSLSHDGTLLRRVFAEICENVRDFTVAESDSGVFLGLRRTASLWTASGRGPVDCRAPRGQRPGRGCEPASALLDEAEDHGIGCVCLFTRIPDFFFRYGFRVVEDRAAIPDKVFKDCQNCPRLYRCDEVAMARGQVPKVSILGPRIEAEQLVRIGG